MQTWLYRWLLAGYKRRMQQQAVLTPETCLNVARHMVKRMSYAFLVSHAADGSCSTRLVQPVADLATWTFWIGTHPASRKVHEIADNPQVTLAIQNTKQQANLVFYGTARATADRALCRRYWQPLWVLFFPQGPTGADFVLLEMAVERIELMNFRRSLVPPEPFGLRPAILLRDGAGWRITT